MGHLSLIPLLPLFRVTDNFPSLGSYRFSSLAIVYMVRSGWDLQWMQRSPKINLTPFQSGKQYELFRTFWALPES